MKTNKELHMMLIMAKQEKCVRDSREVCGFDILEESKIDWSRYSYNGLDALINDLESLNKSIMEYEQRFGE